MAWTDVMEQMVFPEKLEWSVRWERRVAEGSTVRGGRRGSPPTCPRPPGARRASLVKTATRENQDDKDNRVDPEEKETQEFPA